MQAAARADRHQRRGRRRFEDRRWEDAASDFDSAVKLAPEDGLNWHLRARARSRLGEEDAALRDRRAALELGVARLASIYSDTLPPVKGTSGLSSQAARRGSPSQQQQNLPNVRPRIVPQEEHLSNVLRHELPQAVAAFRTREDERERGRERWHA